MIIKLILASVIIGMLALIAIGAEVRIVSQRISPDDDQINNCLKDVIK